MTTRATSVDAGSALAAWDLRGVAVAPLDGGLINDTFAVESSAGRFVLQRVHPVFVPEVHLNIAAVTARLVARGIATSVLRATNDGALWSAQGGRIWRLMTRMPGVGFAAVQSPTQARAAAASLARFHDAVDGLDHQFVGMRVGVHDTEAHLAALERAVSGCTAHRLHGEVAALAAQLAAGAAALPRIDGVPEAVMHGDPKFNNVLFEGDDPIGRERPVCLVDLDTVGPGALHLELGDMWRSWCNPRGEDERSATFDLGIFAASLSGYAGARSAPTPAEREAMVHGVEWITLELAARFAADALLERYFGWDATRFPAAGEHNLARAHGQWSLHTQVLTTRAQRRAAIDAAW